MMVFSDMQPRDISFINLSTGEIVVVDGDEIIKRKLVMNPNGTLGSREIMPAPIDQKGEPQHIPVAQRWATTDQGSQL